MTTRGVFFLQRHIGGKDLNTSSISSIKNKWPTKAATLFERSVVCKSCRGVILEKNKKDILTGAFFTMHQALATASTSATSATAADAASESTPLLWQNDNTKNNSTESGPVDEASAVDPHSYSAGMEDEEYTVDEDWQDEDDEDEDDDDEDDANRPCFVKVCSAIKSGFVIIANVESKDSYECCSLHCSQ